LHLSTGLKLRVKRQEKVPIRKGVGINNDHGFKSDPGAPRLLDTPGKRSPFSWLPIDSFKTLSPPTFGNGSCPVSAAISDNQYSTM